MRTVPLCTYCRQAPGLEAEHVFPDSWYPDCTPGSVQRLTVPSCKPCNERWKRIEENVAGEFVFIMNPDAPGAAGVQVRLSRAWQAERARSPRDRRHRMGKAIKAWRSIAWVPAVPGAPQRTIRTPAGLFLRVSPARRLDPKPIRELAEKFIRGLHWWETAEQLAELEVHAFIVHDETRPDLQPLLRSLEQLPINQNLGPGFWYRRYHAPGQSAWAFLIWGHIFLFALARPAAVDVDEGARASEGNATEDAQG